MLLRLWMGYNEGSIIALAVVLKVTPQTLLISNNSNKMKNKFFLIISVVAFAVIVILNGHVGLKSDAKMDVALANIEALANDEYWIDSCFELCDFDSRWVCIPYLNGQPYLICDYMRGKF